MSYSLKAYLISFLIHATLFLLFMFSPLLSLQKVKKPVEIDLSLEEPEISEFEKRKEELERSKAEKFKIEKLHPNPQLQKPGAEKGEGRLQEISRTQPEEKATPEEALATAQDKRLAQEVLAHTNEGLSSVERKTAHNPQTPAFRGQGESTNIPTPKPPETQGEQYLREKLSLISQIVQKSISYPPLARRMGWEGKVVLAIRIGEDGSLKEVKVLESSGYEILDRNAVETVKRVAGLLPKPPVEVVVKLPVRYGLE